MLTEKSYEKGRKYQLFKQQDKAGKRKLDLTQYFSRSDIPKLKHLGMNFNRFAVVYKYNRSDRHKGIWPHERAL